MKSVAADVCSCSTLIKYLVRGKLHSSVDVNQLEGHSKVLVAVCSEGALGFGRIVHPGSFKREKHLGFYCHATPVQ